MKGGGNFYQVEWVVVVIDVVVVVVGVEYQWVVIVYGDLYVGIGDCLVMLGVGCCQCFVFVVQMVVLE